MNAFAPEEYSKWLASDRISDGERAELEAVIDDEAAIEERFYAYPEFGTAGIRAEVGAGLSRMNSHVVKWVTQSFADVIREGSDGVSVAVCYDCREHSRGFAEDAAGVLAANGITVLLFESMRPTPELSFAVRHYGCAAGINITASHNTSEYNGYKAYGANGAQLPPRDAKRVAKRMSETDVFTSPKYITPAEAESRGLVRYLGDETDEAFLKNVLSLSLATDAVRGELADLRIVYTPFHGAGRLLVPEALSRLGCNCVFPVAEQMIPDGRFPTVASPNPENPESFALAVRLAHEVSADIIIGTDPDADRIAVLARSGDGYVHLSGHATGCILLDYVLRARRARGTLPENAYALKTIVTTDLFRKIARSFGVASEDTFTGFKYLAERRDEIEGAVLGTVVFAYEESYGYMPGNFTRDKDAVSAAVLLAECAAYHKSQGRTLVGALLALYAEHGYHAEETVNLVMPGTDGVMKMRQLMKILRDEPPEEIAGTRVVSRGDYKSGKRFADGAESELPLSGSDVLRFDLEDGSALLARPSGTEPKIKIYALAVGDTLAEAAERAARYADWADDLPRREL
ncbi:MAG: phospho-sugar mutase [Oscillospiraceae bacterium]|jgi:phosphoglucomutase|nr:phospho-sugar mutase [Oscillospiraceae bacterium]